MPLYTTPTISESRRARRRQFGEELQAGMATGLGGVDRLIAAQRQAGLDKEAAADKAEKRETAKADALARAKAEADKLAFDREQLGTRSAIEREQMTAAEARAKRQDDLEAKRLAISEDEMRRKRETEGERARREEEERGEKSSRARAETLIEAMNDTDPDSAVAMMEEVKALGLDDAEIAAIRRKQDQARAGRALSVMEQREKIGALKRRGVSSGGGGLRAENAQADLDLKRARLKAVEAGADAGGKSPTTQEALAVTEIDTLMGNLDVIGKKKPGINTGPIAGRVGVLRSMAGVGDPAVTEFRAEVGSQLGDYIKAMSGAAASDVERAFLQQNVPNVNDSDEEFDAKLKRVQAWAVRKRQTLLAALKAAKRDVSGFQEADSPGAQMTAEQIADAVMAEMPDATDEQIADEIERRKRGGR